MTDHVGSTCPHHHYPYTKFSWKLVIAFSLEKQMFTILVDEQLTSIHLSIHPHPHRWIRYCNITLLLFKPRDKNGSKNSYAEYVEKVGKSYM